MIEQFHFIRPLGLLLLLPTAYLFWRLKQQQRAKDSWKKSIAPHLYQHLLIEKDGAFVLSPEKMLVLLFLIASVVVAGPTWQRQASPFLKDDAIVVVAVDLSQSMSLADVKPSRVYAAKKMAESLIKGRVDNKTALVAFSSTAHVVMPPSRDQAMTLKFLHALDSQSIANPIKQTDSLIAKVEDIRSKSQAPITVVMITDGVSDGAQQEFEKYFEKHNNIKLVTWSVVG
ncbi:vWA domain-containing protein [Vibrio paucivorans]|uniref:VWA domain-containing protein n=1 Tax=Vibrio paucivorans TaxID=2829489 RepID=A0A9X3CBJ3_9VIBR|nr:VWA domain-containing protein [Vibrio paucivorans]MCW8332625.1 VWA domain-containing protein [Vibrio paucivorans]